MVNIYMIENSINNKKYIGATRSTIHRRLRQHQTDARTKQSMVLTSEMYLIGIDYFTIKLLDTVSDDVWEQAEQSAIIEYDTLFPKGYNIAVGGYSLKGKNNPFYGKTHSIETKHNLSLKAKARVGDKNGFFGRKHSSSSKAKISKANTGKKRTEGQKKLLSQINAGVKNPFFGKTHSVDSLEKMRQANITKNILAQQNGQEIFFKDMSQVVNFILEEGLSQAQRKSIASAISKAIKNGAKSYGFLWKTISDNYESVTTIENTSETRK